MKIKHYNQIQENWAKYLNMNGSNHGKIDLTSLVVLEIKIKTVSFFHMSYYQKICNATCLRGHWEITQLL